MRFPYEQYFLDAFLAMCPKPLTRALLGVTGQPSALTVLDLAVSKSPRLPMPVVAPTSWERGELGDLRVSNSMSALWMLVVVVLLVAIMPRSPAAA
jgi:hypothetical protein